MKKLCRRCLPAFLFALVVLGPLSPAFAFDKYTIATPLGFAPETAILTSAKDRGLFARAGIDLTIVPGTTMELITQRFASGEFDAHDYVAPAWQGNKSGVLCSTMIMPLQWRYPGAIIATTPNWKDLIGKTMILNSPANFTTQTAIRILEEHGVPRGSYEIRIVGGFTAPRLRAMLAFPRIAGTIAYYPLLEYIRRAEGVHVLADVGSYPIVMTGLMVKCSDKDDPKKWELDRRVVKVIQDEIAWILDPSKSDATLIPWARAYLVDHKYQEYYGTSYEGRPVTAGKTEPAKAIINGMRTLLSSGPPSTADMERSVSLLLGSVPQDFSKYYDFSLMSK